MVLLEKAHSLGLSNFPQDSLVFGKNTKEVMLFSGHLVRMHMKSFILFLKAGTFITWLRWCFPVFSILELINMYLMLINQWTIHNFYEILWNYVHTLFFSILLSTNCSIDWWFLPDSGITLGNAKRCFCLFLIPLFFLHWLVFYKAELSFHHNCLFIYLYYYGLYGSIFYLSINAFLLFLVLMVKLPQS